MSLFGNPSPAGSAGGQASGGAMGSSVFGGGANLFGTPQAGQPSSGSVFGGAAGSVFGGTPAFGASSGGGLFGSTTPSTPAFGATGQQQTGSLFGGQTPFGQPQQTPGFGQTQQTPAFGQTPQMSAFGQQGQMSVFGGQQQQASPFNTSSGGLFGQQQQQSSIFQPQQSQQMTMFNTGLTTQMAPVAPVVVPLPDREIQAIVDAYRDDAGNPQDGFKYLLLSVTDPAARFKPVGVSDILWAEAMNKLEGLDTMDRERLWPELVHGFKDLSRRLKGEFAKLEESGGRSETEPRIRLTILGLCMMLQLQDEAITADMQRLQATESNVKLLRRHFETDTLPWVQRLHQKEQELQRRLLKIMKMVEGLEGKGFHMQLNRGEAKLGDHLRSLTRQLQGASAELPRRVEALLSISRMQVGLGGASQAVLLGPGKIDNQSLVEMHEVLRQQTEAIARLANVLKRDMRDIDIILTEDTDMIGGNMDIDHSRYYGSQHLIGSTKKSYSGF